MIPLFDVDTLRLSGRAPALPFRIRFEDGRELLFVRLLRVLPGKRLVGEAVFDGLRVLAKLYIAQGSERHWRSEIRGIERLHHAGIPTPSLLTSAECCGGGHIVLTEFLDRAEDLGRRWLELSASSERKCEALSLVKAAFFLLGRLHAAGLVHEDLHFGNFLLDGEDLALIDGDAVRVLPSDKSSRSRLVAANLALLIAQLAPSWDEFRPEMLAAYCGGAGVLDALSVNIEEVVERVRRQRLNDYLSKTVRDCSLFSVQRSTQLFVAAKRHGMADLQPLLAAPDFFLADSVILKNGATCTVGRVEIAGRRVVIKRYNIKDAGHAVSRLFRPSRAWHAWREGHRLRFLAIPTPEPLALIEERLGPLRRRAWLITEYCEGVSLGKQLPADREPSIDEGGAIRSLFEALSSAKLSHGDLKAANLLWDGERVNLIDLDAMIQHRTERAFRRAWGKDRARLLRNWREGSAARLWFDRELPQA